MRPLRKRFIGFGAIVFASLASCGGANVGRATVGRCELDARANLAIDVFASDVEVARTLRERYAGAPRTRVFLIGQNSLREAETRVARALAFYRDLNLTAAAEMIAEALRLFHARVTDVDQRPSWIRALWVAAEIELARGHADAANGFLAHAYNLDPASQPNADEFSPSVRTSYDEMLAARIPGEGLVIVGDRFITHGAPLRTGPPRQDTFVYVNGTRNAGGGQPVAVGEHFVKIEVVGCEPVLRSIRIEAAESRVEVPGQDSLECRPTTSHTIPLAEFVERDVELYPPSPSVRPDPTLQILSSLTRGSNYVITGIGQGFEVTRRNRDIIVTGVSLDDAAEAFEGIDSAPMRACFAVRAGDDTALHWGIAIATTAALVGGGIAIGVAVDNARPYQRPILTDQ